ncbi:hypothetical protein IEN85_22070 [Pelagicoccus sp. NFK12]|uniref:Uncharacterized protein n=1 Tax=Pelagicoccus enzymogenes TaxID=2773457 RepID=A0A927FD58_9BACT|nr:hypothetical protein [Pelagicoccus enzymogenes]MBD5782201.1 hypothetical protein [Pelagicoccus enzymogenes]
MLNNLFSKSLAFHALLIPLAAVITDLGLMFIDRFDFRAIPVAVIATPFFYIILTVPALLHGGVYWSFNWIRVKNPIVALFFTVSVATAIYYVWLNSWGGRLRDELAEATKVMAFSSLVVSSIATFKIKENA